MDAAAARLKLSFPTKSAVVEASNRLRDSIQQISLEPAVLPGEIPPVNYGNIVELRTKFEDLVRPMLE